MSATWPNGVAAWACTARRCSPRSATRPPTPPAGFQAERGLRTHSPDLPCLQLGQRTARRDPAGDAGSTLGGVSSPVCGRISMDRSEPFYGPDFSQLAQEDPEVAQI